MLLLNKTNFYTFWGSVKKSTFVKICNFYFKDVDMDDTANYITIYDKDGRMQFKCHVNKIVEFIRIDRSDESSLSS